MGGLLCFCISPDTALNFQCTVKQGPFSRAEAGEVPLHICTLCCEFETEPGMFSMKRRKVLLTGGFQQMEGNNKTLTVSLV